MPRRRSSKQNDVQDVLEDEWGDELEEESEEELKSGSSLRGGLSNGADPLSHPDAQKPSPLSTSQTTTEYLPRSSTLDTSSLILSTSTLLPIPISPPEYHLLPTALAHIPPLDKCLRGASLEAGVFGWGPHSGPECCKFVIFLRHTSPLAVEFLSAIQSPFSECRFYVEFGSKRAPAFPHKFFFKQSDYAFDMVNVEGLGRDREILLGLVPGRGVGAGTRVPVCLNVIGDRGCVLFNMQLGYYEYDQTVPLKTYYEQASWKGHIYLDFLRSQRPTLEEARFPGRYLASEIIGPLPISDSDSSLTSQSSGMESISTISRPPRKRRLPLKTRDTSKPVFRLSSRKRRSKSTSALPNSARPTVSTTPTKQKYVTLKFVDPPPSALGMPSVTQWSPEEKAARRRLVAFSCKTDKYRLIAEFSALPVAHLNLAPQASIVVSCIYVGPTASQLQNSCIITSYDFINLVKWMLGSPSWYEVDERNRVRRNLEVFSPKTLHKAGSYDYWDLFGQVTGYDHPKPWNIHKDFKVFDWALMEVMMKEIVKKYSVLPNGDSAVGSLADDVGEDEDIEGEFLEARRDLMAHWMAHSESRGREMAMKLGTWNSGLERLPGHACDNKLTSGSPFAAPKGSDDVFTHPIQSAQFASQNALQNHLTFFPNVETPDHPLDQTSPIPQMGFPSYNITTGHVSSHHVQQDIQPEYCQTSEHHELQMSENKGMPDVGTVDAEILHGSSWIGLDSHQQDDSSYWLNIPFSPGPNNS